MNKLQFFLCTSILMSTSIFQAVDIFYEISRGHIRAVKSWMKSSPDISIRNEQGQSVLHAVVLADNETLVERVLRSNADVNALDKAGKTALDYAIDCGQKAIIIELLKHKAKVTTAENAEFVKVFIEQIGSVFSIGKILAALGLFCIGYIFIGFVCIASSFVGSWVVLAGGACSIHGARRLIMNSWSKPFDVQFYEQESYQLTAVCQN